MLGAIFMLTTREPQRLKLPNVIFGTFVSLVLCNLIYRVSWFLRNFKGRFFFKQKISGVGLMFFKKIIFHVYFSDQEIISTKRKKNKQKKLSEVNWLDVQPFYFCCWKVHFSSIDFAESISDSWIYFCRVIESAKFMRLFILFEN